MQVFSSRKREHSIGWAFTALLLGILVIGSIVAWRGDDALMRATSIIAGLSWLALLWAMLSQNAAWAAWRGCLQFIACWLIFPLFKAIRQGWISRVYDQELLALDRTLWAGQSLPEHCLTWENFWLSEVLSFGYLSFYLIVLLPMCWYAWKRKEREARDFFLGLSMMYLAGFSGYLLFPAGGPFIAFPQIFPYPPEGGVITSFLVRLVGQGVTGMDVFPSLHTGISLYILGFFVLIPKQTRVHRLVVLALAALVAPLIAATVYLRYHYGLDLIAGAALALIVLIFVRREYQKS